MEGRSAELIDIIAGVIGFVKSFYECYYRAIAFARALRKPDDFSPPIPTPPPNSPLQAAYRSIDPTVPT
jgi:hypothetical protein